MDRGQYIRQETEVRDGDIMLGSRFHQLKETYNGVALFFLTSYAATLTQFIDGITISMNPFMFPLIVAARG